MFKKIKNFIKKLTLFDRILIGLAVLGVFLFAYIFFRKSSNITVTLKVGQDSIFYSAWAPQSFDTSGMTPSLQRLFHKGMREKDGLGRVSAEVLDVNSYYLISTRVSLYLKAKLRVVYSRANNQYSYKGTPVLVGSKIKLYLDDILVDALVTGIDGKEDPREKKTLIVEAEVREENSTFLETSGTKEYVADAIKVGDEERDSQGDTVIKILNKRVEPAKKVTTSADGRVFVQSNPLRKDVFLNLQINAVKVQGRYFIFDDVPILVDQGVPICTSTVCFYPTVTRIIEVK